MNVETRYISIQTAGNNQVIDLSEQIARTLSDTQIRDGIVVLFVIGSTAALTTTEAEPGLLNHDLKAAYEKFAPENGSYVHEQTWHDDNGHSHVRASLTGPSLTIPLVDGRLTLGTWQQVILIDFDTRPRRREVVVQILGK